MNTSLPRKESPPNRSALSQGIFSRLAAPFLGKSRSFADFEINLDEPLKEYRAGDAVKGKITLVVPKPVRITHLVLSLHGFAKVFKTVTAPGEGLPSDVRTPSPGRGNSGIEYLGNGLISLFEDEVILCGAGKLIPGQYSFGFEARFPFKSLPSSLSFERGTISYVLVATLTRPTTIAPTMSREKEVQFRESLDVAAVPRPRQRKLHLKALNRSQRRPPRRALTDRTVNSSSNTNQSSTESSGYQHDDMPRNSVTSDTSLESGLDSIVLQSTQTPSRVTFNGDTPTSPTQITEATISATVDVLRGGFLPGDYVPIRIFVKHTRALKSMHGVIITFFRKARIDASPSVSEASRATSRTGSSGISLSGRNSHLYRMDLAQAFAPMVINPLTLEADIKTAVKIPEDVFPTVSNVPGQMIVFTYHVEIIMDLGGKFSKHERLLSGLGMTSQAPVFSMGAKSSAFEHGLPMAVEIYHLIDTSEIRREKGVGQETFEILIGSVDSKRKTIDARKVDLWMEDINNEENVSHADAELESHEEIQLSSPLVPQYIAANSNETIQPAIPSTLPQISLSSFQEPVDEKERMRLAEQRLLPSAPMDSEDYATGSGSVPFAIPSAPPLSDLEFYHAAGDANGIADFEHLGLPVFDDETAPAYERETHITVGSSSGANLPLADSMQNNTDDKAELERQRLLAMASSPDDHNEEGTHPVLPDLSMPSVPVLEDGILSTGDTHDLPQPLPEYSHR